MLILPDGPDPRYHAETQADERTFLVVVDDSVEMRAALHFAARRAQGTNGRVALVSVVSPPDLGPWMFVGSLMREEAREKAEQLVHRAASVVRIERGETPTVHIREGEILTEVLRLIDEDPSISILVLATAPASDDPGPLVRALTGRHVNRLRIPLTLVPGCLTDEEIDLLT
ncbi:universal stress protein [Pararhodospirillum photometricum]|nr:universal stress protein [Pararhodospirillum photometricum]